MMLWVNFDYAATSIAHFTIIGRYGLLAISQAGQYCWPIDWPPMSFQDHFRRLSGFRAMSAPHLIASE
jgi:hypothetical protein